MKSIFDTAVRDEVIGRVRSLSPGHKAQWGKMTVSQMVRHCILCDEYYFGNVKVKRSLIGLIFGRLAIRDILRNEVSTFRRNTPTPKQFEAVGNTDNLNADKEKWVTLIERYEKFASEHFVHWFFGKLTKEQLGQFVYKHTDHHLRQFAA